MPAAFFTRTQVGALISPLNNHVTGTQRALTGALGSGVPSLVTLVSTMIAMAVLRWRLSYGLVVSSSALQTTHSNHTCTEWHPSVKPARETRASAATAVGAS
jgi:ABC-type multidrug transport system fused ATPase/permease subunit